MDDAAAAVQEALEKALAGEPESALAKVLTLAAAVGIGTPWIMVAEPLLQRVFERINNKTGKDAVAAIAKEVETEAGLKRVAAEVGKHVEAVLKVLFAQQAARGGVGMGSLIEVTESSVADVVPKLAVLLHRMEERLSGASVGSDDKEPLAAAIVLTGPTVTMRAVAKADHREFQVRAVRYGAIPRLVFDLTNMARVDVRIVNVYVDVLEVLDVEIEEIWSWYGMTRPVRKYSVALEPREGRYRCMPQDGANDVYLALSPGELELFHVELNLQPNEKLYCARVTVECSTSGKNFFQEFRRAFAFGVYDPDAHIVVKDDRAMLGPPHEDLGDDCVREASAAVIRKS